MKFLIDENFPRSSVDLIESCGHEAVPFDSACEFGDDDETVFAAANGGMFEINFCVIANILRTFYGTILML